jgi:hypothetical protein
MSSLECRRGARCPARCTGEGCRESVGPDKRRGQRGIHQLLEGWGLLRVGGQTGVLPGAVACRRNVVDRAGEVRGSVVEFQEWGVLTTAIPMNDELKGPSGCCIHANDLIRRHKTHSKEREHVRCTRLCDRHHPAQPLLFLSRLFHIAFGRTIGVRTEQRGHCEWRVHTVSCSTARCML